MDTKLVLPMFALMLLSGCQQGEFAAVSSPQETEDPTYWVDGYWLAYNSFTDQHMIATPDGIDARAGGTFTGVYHWSDGSGTKHHHDVIVEWTIIHPKQFDPSKPAQSWLEGETKPFPKGRDVATDISDVATDLLAEQMVRDLLPEFVPQRLLFDGQNLSEWQASNEFPEGGHWVQLNSVSFKKFKKGSYVPPTFPR